MPISSRLLDSGPLFSYLFVNCGTTSLKHLAVQLGENCRNVERWRNRGLIPPEAAERALEPLGVDPSEIWGEAYWDAIPLVRGDGRPFDTKEQRRVLA